MHEWTVQLTQEWFENQKLPEHTKGKQTKQANTKTLTFTWYGFFLQEICEYQTAYFLSFFDELAL